ncbi:hypothetical protein B566_EDAN009397 [Ephemera danica]|nr:hypothetical protein B566_EDAN009397 [Ephemera danica]
MKTVVAAIAILLQVLPLLTEATSSPQSIDPKDIANILGRRYYFSTVPLNVGEGVTLCLELNMTLAGFETPEEYDAVTNYVTYTLGRTDIHWTSGARQYTSWIWTNSGEPFTFFRWDVSEPDITDGAQQQGLAVLNGLMQDQPTVTSYRCICEEKTSC